MSIKSLVQQVIKSSPQLVGDYGRVDILLDLIVIIRAGNTMEDLEYLGEIKSVFIEATQTAKKIALLRGNYSEEKNVWLNNMLNKLEQETKGKSSTEQYDIVETELALFAKDRDTSLRSKIPFAYYEENWPSERIVWYARILDNENRYTTATLTRVANLITKAYPTKANDMLSIKELTTSIGTLMHGTLKKEVGEDNTGEILDSMREDIINVPDVAPPAPDAPFPKLK